MNEMLYNQYGRNMINDFHNVSGEDVKLCVIFEGPVPHHAFRNEKIDIIPMANSEHDKFIKYFGHLHQARGLTIKLSEDNKKADLVWNYRFDAIRFSFKIFSIIQAINLIKTDEPFAWIDADIRCLQKFNNKDMKPFLPEGSELMSYLGRDNQPYSECGFLGFNPKHPKCFEFLERMKNIYTQGEIFSLNEWHDSWVWDHVRREYEIKKFEFKNISGEASGLEHPFVNCGLGKYFDHLKGVQRKINGQSANSDYHFKT